MIYHKAGNDLLAQQHRRNHNPNDSLQGVRHRAEEE